MINDLKTRKKIAKTIKELREYHAQFNPCMRQDRIADFLEIPFEYYQKIESGEKPINVVQLGKIANLFEVPLIYFIDKRKCRSVKLTPYKICGEQNEEGE
jgi:transcriptional regulator with XRE-family HTH domain